ncbi:MAG: alcohol dehydrogenase [Planctomycetes bacterium]|nr:alcohol dehydrogenase [Planctomycetota bacterium]
MSLRDFSLGTRVVFGPNATDRLGTFAAEFGGRVFVVTDPHIVAAGHVDRAERSLASAGLEVRRYEGVRENPTSADVAACRAALGDWNPDLLVGLGGGSSIDVAKGCNLVRAGGGTMEDYWGVGKAKGTLLPLIAVPTTAGTGTEAQSFALVAQEDTHQKMACGDPQMLPRLAVLDPILTTTLPPFVTACTGLDTIGHAVETMVTKKRNAFSRPFSVEAFRLAHASLPLVLDDPDNLDARGDMMLAATFAGVAIENSMLGAAHSLANPLTAHHDLAHGLAVGLVLPGVVRFNSEHAEIAELYEGLARGARLNSVSALVQRLEELLDLCRIEHSLTAHGVPTTGVTGLAEEALRQWTAQFNPREVTVQDLERLLIAAL